MTISSLDDGFTWLTLDGFTINVDGNTFLRGGIAHKIP